MIPNLNSNDEKQCGNSNSAPPTLSQGCGGVVIPEKCPVKFANY